MTIEMTSVVSRSEEQVCAEVDGEVVMMSVERGNYYGLDAVGSRIWELIETPSTVAALCDRLVAEYAVERGQCETDVLHFLQQMSDQGLVKLDGAVD